MSDGEDDPGAHQGPTHLDHTLLKVLHGAFQWEPDQNRDGPHQDEKGQSPSLRVGAEAEHPGHVVTEVDQHRQERAEMEHRRHRQVGGCHLDTELGEKGGDDDEMARGRHRQELGEALDQTPDHRGEHQGTLVVIRSRS
jgi:hypothetical protein